MGTVWLVRHREFGSERALKLIVSGIARDHQVRARFRREAQILDKLNHPNAVRVYDARMGNEVAFIEMEFVRGESLNQILVPGQPMSLEWTTELLDQLCDVLQAANDEGIIHRDLKPPNLMLVDGKQPGRKVLKLLDFGIAKIREAADDVHTLTGSFMGTPLYSSPEQIVGEGVDARSDIYSVGLILYEMLTGYRPFDGSINAIIYKHTMVPPPPFAEMNPKANVPPAVESVVLKCLSKEPDQRPQSPRELAELFHRALAGAGVEPVTARKKGPATDTFEIATEGRHKLAPAAGWASLVGVIGLAAAFLMANRGWLTPTVTGGGSPGNPPNAREPLEKNVTKTSRPADPSTIAAQLKHWAARGFVPEETALKPGAWPKTLVRVEDRMPFHRDASGIYIPRGYEASSEPADDNYPKLLERKESPERKGATFARIIGGTFKMGSVKAGDAGILGSEADVPGPEVTLSSFYMQTTEETNGEIESYMESLPPDVCKEWRDAYKNLKRSNGLDAEAKKFPAVQIPWRIAADYAQVNGGKLPTDAQWEYAARSRGEDKPYVWGSGAETPQTVNVSSFAVRKVALYPRDMTAQGIYDLAGNVQEWCRDPFKEYEPGAPAQKDPQPAPLKGNESDDRKMVLRGSSGFTEWNQAKTTSREPHLGGEVTNYIGFRMVIECPEGPPDP
jgi:serine/threonine-protein kinase